MSKTWEKLHYIDLQKAFQEDCEALIKKFLLHSTFKFDVFSKLWRDEKFAFIFLGKYREYEIAHFSELLFQCAKKYLLFPDCIYTKTAGLYILYGLYFKQPIRNLVKIRLLQTELKSLTDFIEVLKQQQLLQTLYILKILFRANAFDFTLTQHPLYIESRYCQADVNLANNIFAEDFSKVAAELESETIVAVRNIREIDQMFAKQLAAYQRNNPEALLTADNSTELLNELELAMVKSQAHTSNKENVDNDSLRDGNDGKGTEESNHISVREKIKNKAFSSDSRSKFIKDRQGTGS